MGVKKQDWYINELDKVQCKGIQWNLKIYDEFYWDSLEQNVSQCDNKL